MSDIFYQNVGISSELYIQILIQNYTNLTLLIILFMDKESLQEFYQVCYEPPVGSESILFLGNTNAGKSTLINLFLGAKLTQITNKKKMNFSITIEKSDNPNMKFAQIGNKNQSCTRYTEKYEKNGWVMIDTPGEKSTKGDEEEFLNTIAMSKLYLKDRKIKQVLVVNYNDLISVKGNEFIDFVENFLKRYSQEEFLLVVQSCLLVISQVDTQQNTLQELIQFIQEINQSERLSKKMNAFLRVLIDFERILVFPKINCSSLKDYIKKIHSKISEIQYMEICQDLLCIPPANVQLVIKKHISNYYKKLGSICEKIIKIVDQKGMNILKSSIQSEYDKLKQVQSLMNSPYFQDSKKDQEYCFRALGIQSYQKLFFQMIQEIQFFGYLLPNFQFDQSVTQGIIQSLNNLLKTYERKVVEMKNQKHLKDMQIKFELEYEQKIAQQTKKIFEEQQRLQREQRARNRQANQNFMKQYLKKPQFIHNYSSKIENRSQNYPNYSNQVIYTGPQYSNNPQYKYTPEPIYNNRQNQQPKSKEFFAMIQEFFSGPVIPKPKRQKLSIFPPQRKKQHFQPYSIPQISKNSPPVFKKPQFIDLSQYRQNVQDPKVLDRQIEQLQKISKQEEQFLNEMKRAKMT